jgi:hypothetical protein
MAKVQEGPMQGQVEPRETGLMAAAASRGDVDMQVATAHRYPRDVAKFKEQAKTLACLDQETAQACFYAIPRKNKDGKKITIEGPSVRLAEICASCWGNLRVQARIIGEEAGQVVAQGVAWDLERNVAISVDNRQKVTTRDGRRFSDDMVVVTANSAASRALRNAIFRVVPRSYIDAICAEAKRVAVGDQKTIDQRRQICIAWFAKLGIEKDRVLAAVDARSVDEIDADRLTRLQGFATAIKDGDAEIDTIFPPPPVAPTKADAPTFGFSSQKAQGGPGSQPKAEAEPTAKDNAPAAPAGQQRPQAKDTTDLSGLVDADENPDDTIPY